jgi:hypothetical protein
MSSIFISYRRVGALVHARALFERLRHEFGPNEVFIDLEGVDYGLDFIDILNEQLNGCQVMLAVIDPQWATAVDKQGRRRIDREFDYVRVEIVTALGRGIRTVPVLIDGAEMPDASDLPEPLRPLTRRNALMLDFNRFDAEISRLIGVIRKILAAPSAGARGPSEGAGAQQKEAIRLRDEVERTGRETEARRLAQDSERQVAEEAARKTKEAEAFGVQQEEERKAQEETLRLKRQVEAQRIREEAEQRAKAEEVAERAREAEKLRENQELERQAKGQEELREREEADRKNKEAEALRVAQVAQRQAAEEDARKAQEAEVLRTQEETERRANAEEAACRAKQLETLRQRQEVERRAKEEKSLRLRQEAVPSAEDAVECRLTEEAERGIVAQHAEEAQALHEQQKVERTTDVQVQRLGEESGGIEREAAEDSTPRANEHVELSQPFSAAITESRLAPPARVSAVVRLAAKLLCALLVSALALILILEIPWASNPEAKDGRGTAATFVDPGSLVVTDDGTVFVLDVVKIRKISRLGDVTTIKSPTSPDHSLAAINIASNGASTVYASGCGSTVRLAPSVVVAGESEPCANALAVDQTGKVFLAEGSAIVEIAENGSRKILAGAIDAQGDEDGIGGNARFRAPQALAIDPSGNVFVVDGESALVRKVSPVGVVTTVAGGATSKEDRVDGRGRAAKFNRPQGIVIDHSGNAYVGEMSGLRKIAPDGQVSTISGEAFFVVWPGLTVDTLDNVYVTAHTQVDKIAPNGSIRVLAGASESGNVDGAPGVGRLGFVAAIAVDGSGTVFVADSGNLNIRTIAPDGTITTLAGAGPVASNAVLLALVHIGIGLIWAGLLWLLFRRRGNFLLA